MVQNQLVEPRRDGESANHREKRMAENLRMARNDFFARSRQEYTQAFETIQLKFPPKGCFDVFVRLVPFCRRERRGTQKDEFIAVVAVSSDLLAVFAQFLSPIFSNAIRKNRVLAVTVSTEIKRVSSSVL